MIKFVFWEITHLWVMKNRLESEKPAEKHTQENFAMARANTKEEKVF